MAGSGGNDGGASRAGAGAVARLGARARPGLPRAAGADREAPHGVDDEPHGPAALGDGRPGARRGPPAAQPPPGRAHRSARPRSVGRGGGDDAGRGDARLTRRPAPPPLDGLPGGRSAAVPRRRDRRRTALRPEQPPGRGGHRHRVQAAARRRDRAGRMEAGTVRDPPTRAGPRRSDRGSGRRRTAARSRFAPTRPCPGPGRRAASAGRSRTTTRSTIRSS